MGEVSHLHIPKAILILALTHDLIGCSAAVAYLTPSVLARKNLTIAVGVMVEKILFSTSTSASASVSDSQPRATSVLLCPAKKKDGQRYIAHARKEVILSAGTVSTPHLLLVSGIGPKGELEKMDVKVVKDSPMVGKNLSDVSTSFSISYHLFFPVTFILTPSPFLSLFPYKINTIRTLTSPTPLKAHFLRAPHLPSETIRHMGSLHLQTPPHRTRPLPLVMERRRSTRSTRSRNSRLL
jgi:choline dehydrogenase-like flavoprotein